MRMLHSWKSWGRFFDRGMMLCLLPGNLGSLAVARTLAEAGVTGVVVVESDTAPYVCRKTAPAEATIFGVVPAMGVGVFPANQTAEVLPELQALFPGVRAYAHVVEAGLSALNPVVHPAGVLMNAGRIERSQGEFRFYEEGVSSSVVAVIEALDLERLGDRICARSRPDSGRRSLPCRRIWSRW